MTDLSGVPTGELVEELVKREECIAVESIKPPSDIFPWYMIKHTFDRYYQISGHGKIIVVQGVE